MLAGVKLMTIRASPVNPAISFGIIMWNPTGPSPINSETSGTSNWTSSFIFYAFPFLGSFLALLFFRFVYQKTTETMVEAEEEGSDDERNENALMG